MALPRLRPGLCFLRHALGPASRRFVPRRPSAAVTHLRVSLLVRFASSTPSRSLCPSCSQPLPSNLPACPSCWSIHPLPPNISHHELFGLPYDPNPFVVDISTLKRRFREAQSACHPDAWASKSPKEQGLAHTLSSRLNEAYQCLLNPLPRAEYILERNGIHMSEGDQVEDMEFMAEIMEAREIIDGSTPENKCSIDELIQTNEENIRHTVGRLTSLIEQQDWPEVKATAVRLRYLQGIDRAAKDWMDNNT